MNRTLQTVLAGATLAILAACASPQYIMSTTDGTMITANGKPKLDEKTGMYTYKDTEGRAHTIQKEKVTQVMER